MAAEHYDAYLSHGHGDAAWAHKLAENLERLGIRVFLDAWELVAGDLIAVRLQDGLAAAGAVVFVVSPESVGRGWVNEEFAAAVAAAAAGRQRLIPVLYGEVALPPLVAARLYVDFRQVDDPAAYEATVSELAAAIRGQPVRERPVPPSSAGVDAKQVESRVLAGGISADLVDPDRGIPREEDDLGVSTYVAMMATAIARKDTKLPLSIGLFGEWGSGKSYFMGLLRKQVKELASSGDPAYNSGIVQIGFNAWSYADANLWASLGDEIFRQLAGPTDEEEEAEDRERRERLRTWLADEQGRIKELEAAKAAATTEVAKLRGELERREHDRANSALTLLRATVQAVQTDKHTSRRTDQRLGEARAER